MSLRTILLWLLLLACIRLAFWMNDSVVSQQKPAAVVDVVSIVKKPAPIKLAEPNKANEREVKCLARNIYFEARGEGYVGQVAVAFVTANRAKHKSYPNDVCEVVTQRTPKVCQFSWVCTHGDRKIKEHGNPLWDEAVKVANLVLTHYNSMWDPTNGALFYHANYVQPPWSKVFHKTAVIGAHIFYKNTL